MKRILFLSVISILCYRITFAIIAYPFAVTIKSPSGEMKIYLKGDECFKYAITEDGYPLLQNGDKWYFALVNERGELCASSFLAEKEECRSEELKSFLTLQSKDIINTINCQNRNKAKRTKTYNVEKSRNPKIGGKRKVLVVMMQFADVKFSKSQTDFDDLFNKENYSEDGAKGSVYDYYKYVSYGQLDLQCDVIGPFETKYEMAYYGGNVGMGSNDKNPFALFTEALYKAAETVDLAEYDADGDGYIDNLHIIYAGYGEEAGASSDAIWAHEMTFSPQTIDGMKIDKYSCAPELRSNRGGGISRIGPHCHEIGHALGAADYYDTDYNVGGTYSGTGSWDVMASGNWNEDGISPANFNPYVKAYDYGWCNVVEITENTDIEMISSSSDNTVYKLNTPNSGELFLLENRQQQFFDSNVPGHGLLIFHISSDIEKLCKTNSVNASYPQGCYIVCASSGYRQPSSNAVSYGAIDSDGCPFNGTSGRMTFDYYSTPAALCNNGESAGFAISNIKENNDKSISLSIDFNEDLNKNDEPKADGEIIWQETFSNVLLGSFWSQEYIEGSSKWECKRVLSLGEQNGWLQITPSFSPFEPNSDRVVTRLISSNIDTGKKEYVLSLKMACKNSGGSGTDSVKVHFYTGNDIIAGKSVSFPVISEVWSEHSVLIDESMQPLKFAIDGVCYRNSTLMISDIKIREKQLYSAIISTMTNGYNIEFYNLQGQKIPASEIPYYRGIYIQKGKKQIINVK